MNTYVTEEVGSSLKFGYGYKQTLPHDWHQQLHSIG